MTKSTSPWHNLLQRTQKADRRERQAEAHFDYEDCSGPGAKPNNLTWDEWREHLNRDFSKDDK